MKASTQFFHTFDYTMDDQAVQDIMAKISNRNPSSEKLPSLRKPFKIDTSLIQVKIIRLLNTKLRRGLRKESLRNKSNIRCSKIY